jgi:hypothetical protein
MLFLENLNGSRMNNPNNLKRKKIKCNSIISVNTLSKLNTIKDLKLSDLESKKYTKKSITI